MTSRYLSARRAHEDLLAGFERIRAELEVPGEFSASAIDEAMAVASRQAEAMADMTELPFVTIDPATSMDLDQAVYIARSRSGFRVHYAIADVPWFVAPGGALDLEVRQRGLTLYSPDRKVPLHPAVLSEDAASLLPGVDRPALVWVLDLDSDGALAGIRVQRALVRSRAKLSYEGVQDQLDRDAAEENLLLVREVGELLQRQEALRGGVSLPGAEQEIVAEGSSYRLEMRSPLPIEGWNAQISLLTGRAAAQVMLEAGVGILRTMPDPGPADVGRVRAVARSLGIAWERGETYPQVIARMDPAVPAQAALLNAVPALLRGAGYTAFDGQVPELAKHSAVAAPYAHVTAPLRRLVDRWGLQICLSLCENSAIPEWVQGSLFDVPELMLAGGRRAKALERANVDLVEAFVLQDRVGEVFDAVVLDQRDASSLIQVENPAVIARTKGALPLGEKVQVLLAGVDLGRRQVDFTLA